MYDGGESLGIRRFLEKINDVANLGKFSYAEKSLLKLKLAGIAEEFSDSRGRGSRYRRGLQVRPLKTHFSFRDETSRGPSRSSMVHGSNPIFIMHSGGFI
ncbi:hypothetical protein TNCV_2105951 [Trichonephila clavipes]|nr:hypothetical protein TNCV_2105951 [Trichonephila clavipes]